ncbi:MAG: hypothetical protein H7Y13_13625 [Sphingobacteriaceae bacterium]|nr:hypothetical protein [Sphingobacteriaceae bacterium]
MKAKTYRLGLAAILYCKFCFFLLPLQTRAQTPQNGDINIVFLKDTIFQNGNSFSFNRASVTNSSSVKQVFGLELSIPENWQSLFDNRKLFQLSPNETIELPIRITASSDASSDKFYPIHLLVKKEGISTKNTRTFFAGLRPNSKWKAVLMTPELKLDRLNKETNFRIILSNTGNVAEDLTVRFNTGLELTQPREVYVKLGAGSDTVVQVGIITSLRHLSEFKPQGIAIEIINKNKDRQYLTQRVYSNNTVFLENPSRWYRVPLFVEFVSQNLASKQEQLYYINSAGDLKLDKERSLSFNFRSNDYYIDNTASTRYANITYHTKKLDLSVGDQIEFNSFLFDGLGARVSYKANNGYSFNAVGVKSRLGNANQFCFEQQLQTGKNKILNETVLNLDVARRINSYINLTEYDWNIGKSNSLIIGAGLGLESAELLSSRVNTNGHSLGVRYDLNSRRVIIRSANNFSSKNFPGMERGVARSTNEVRILFKKNYFAGAVGDYNSRTAGYFETDRLLYMFGGRSSEYGLRSGFNKGQNNVVLTASIVNQLQDSSSKIPFKSHKINVNTGLAFSRSLYFMLSANLAKSRMVENLNSKAVYSLNAYGTLQNKNAGLSFRLDQGPFYYAELRAFETDGSKISRFQFAPYAECDFFKSQVNARAELNYARDIANRYETYIARIDLNVNLNKRGLSLRFYNNHNLNRDSRLNSMNISLRKNFNVPLPGLQKYHIMKVVLFKDHNNDGKFDSADEPLPDANIQIRSQYFRTNVLGEAVYKNISKGKYQLDLSRVNSKGWVPANGLKQVLNFDKSLDWFIPFCESKFLSGQLNVVKDPFSKLRFDPSNIRITAISSKGESFSTLTDDEGAFFLNLPADTYNVKINTNVFNVDFRVLQDLHRIDLTQKAQESVVFEIRESKRKMNIIKQ